MVLVETIPDIPSLGKEIPMMIQLSFSIFLAHLDKMRDGKGRLSLKVGRGRGTRLSEDAGLGDAGAAGTWERGDEGTWGREDFGTRRRTGIRVRDKQIAHDFCAELVKYFFFEGQM